MSTRNMVIGLASLALIFFGIRVQPLHSSPSAEVQGWPQDTIERFHHESQGAVVMPTAFIRALRLTSGTRALDPSLLARFGFQPGTERERPWPLGMTSDDGTLSNGIPMVGLTCAACHTGSLTVRGSRLLVEGGSANLSLGFISVLRKALTETAKDQKRRKVFLAQVVASGYPRDRASTDLNAEAARDEFTSSASESLPKSTPGGPGIVDALTGIAFNAMTLGLKVRDNARTGLAPTNFPPLWDIWRFDWVQYNAAVRQPMDRNVGEAIGLGARLQIVDPTTGKLRPQTERWKSTVRVKSLYWMESALESLKPPVWPAAFGALDQNKIARGRALFDANCQRCHGVVAIQGTNEWHLRVLPLAVIGTDRNQAVGFAKSRFDMTKLGLSARERGPEALAYVVERVKLEAYKTAGIPKSLWPTYDGWGRKAIAATPCGYKARPLVGMWATPPFLHNGSVPSFYDLLSDKRPSRPILGNSEFDPRKLGQVQTVVPGRTYIMDTSLQGNGNGGHWFTNDSMRAGRIGAKLSEDDKYALLEYLKAATYATYPRSTILQSAVPALPCEDQRDWADNIPY
jgi:hypothetical protein